MNYQSQWISVGDVEGMRGVSSRMRLNITQFNSIKWTLWCSGFREGKVRPLPGILWCGCPLIPSKMGLLDDSSHHYNLIFILFEGTKNRNLIFILQVSIDVCFQCFSSMHWNDVEMHLDDEITIDWVVGKFFLFFIVDFWGKTSIIALLAYSSSGITNSR